MEIRNLDFTFQNEGNHLTGLIQTNKLSHILGSTKKWREVISPNVFAKAISNAFENGRDVDFIADHDDSKILASTKNNSLELREDEQGLHVSAKIVDTSWAKDTLELVKSGIISGLSFGMTVNSQRWSKCDDGIDLRIIDDIDLFEVSAVRNPAYPLTNLESRGIDVEDVEIPNEEGGENMSNMEETLNKILDLLTKDKEVNPEVVDDVVEEVVENREDEIVDEKQPKEEKVDIAEIVKKAVVEAMKEVLPPKKEDKPVEPKEDEKEPEETTEKDSEKEEERENEENEIQKDLKHNTDKDDEVAKDKAITGTNDSQMDKEKEEKRSLDDDLKEFFKGLE